MRTGAILAAVVAVIAIAFGIYMIDVDQTQEAKLPEVSVEGGQMPEFDAEVGDVDVTEEEVTVTVPKVEVNPPEDEVAEND
ncbi:MAG: hypothetical protein ACU0CC_16195 [Sagittula sp.]|jgi:hypothetical protein|uniref:hypothetical protein n=1 Tax=unclassified Sagittula TaxID=2624628 RepID=UPI000C2D5709|nr:MULTISPECIES: hypothetical protein [unclassified Sagittula]AUC53441.1 hypothetical protein CDO87_09655 [Sagittula sp. P11]WHZ35051.1 hypothetical protein QNI11_20775 [Sagittula sp. MA-2]